MDQAENIASGKKLRELRLEAGLTKTELSRRTGMTRNFISNLERGTNAPSLSTFIKLQSVFDGSIGELWGYSDYIATPGGKLRFLRLRLGLTQTQLSIRTGLLPVTISNYEANKSRPSDISIYRLAQAMTMEPSELFRLFDTSGEWETPKELSSFGQKIKATRIKMGLSRALLAKRVGCTVRLVKYVEECPGNIRVNPEVLTIAQTLGISPVEADELLANSDIYLGARIRKYRLEAGLTMAEVGRRLGISRQRVEQIEKRKYSGVQYLSELACMFGVSVEELLIAAP